MSKVHCLEILQAAKEYFHKKDLIRLLFRQEDFWT